MNSQPRQLFQIFSMESNTNFNSFRVGITLTNFVNDMAVNSIRIQYTFCDMNLFQYLLKSSLFDVVRIFDSKMWQNLSLETQKIFQFKSIKVFVKN